MRREALVLIEDDRDAQRMCVTWERIGDRYGRAGSEEEKAEVRLLWSELSGVDIEDIERLIPMLFGNNILGAGGIVDGEVLMFIRNRVDRILSRGKRDPDSVPD